MCGPSDVLPGRSRRSCCCRFGILIGIVGSVVCAAGVAAESPNLDGGAREREVIAAQGKLKKNPNDASAAGVLGRYYCFVKRDWEAGLPLLARSDDLVLKGPAQSDLNNPREPDRQLALADQWWDLAQRRGDETKNSMLDRAAYWYVQALPRLQEPDRSRVLVRWEELRDAGIVIGPHELYGNMLGGRLDGRGRLVRKHGGSGGSERAVARGLQWLAMHQCADGGWNFDLRKCPGCLGKCPDSGEAGDARIAATAMALLPFLGAVQTHKTGKYKTQVNNGLRFLCEKMKTTPLGGSLWESGGRGHMYSHGMATIALCECYAMTRDKQLHKPALEAVNFVCSAQDPIGGGWRYKPREKGDTSVTGWQIMALKTGHVAHLHVPPTVLKRAFGYLDTVQTDNGAAYGYRGPGSGRATSAIGLLCRMYLGWKKDNPALRRGVQQISDWGPDRGNMYYNYYATQVCFHWQGDVWKKWNGQMRDWLVNLQAKESHPAGSWMLTGNDYGFKRGGRLYCTALATMILETYYRYLPIYREDPTEDQ